MAAIKKRQYLIYCLSGKKQSDIFYVGVTSLTLIQKLKMHLGNRDGSNEARCNKLEQYKDCLEIHLLEDLGIVTKKRAYKKEIEWMVKMANNGHELVNKSGLNGFIHPSRVGKFELQKQK